MMDPKRALTNPLHLPLQLTPLLFLFFYHSFLQITSYKLNGRNFFQWPQLVHMVIRGNGKIDFIDGTV